jgi:hypothetical protein
MTKHFTKKENLTVLALVILFLACMFAGCANNMRGHYKSEFNRYIDSAEKYRVEAHNLFGIMEKIRGTPEYSEANKKFDENIALSKAFIDSAQKQIDSLASITQ